MQDKHSNRSSQVEDEYEEEISCLRNKITSQEYQLNDMKNFIKNQKAIHTKELEQLRLSYEQSMQHTTGKYEADLNALSLQLESAREQASPNGSHAAIEIVNFLKNELESRMAEFFNAVTLRVGGLSERFARCEKLIAHRMETFVNVQYEKSLQVLSISKELEDRSKLLERQKRFLEKIVEEKQDSDQMYEKQLCFLEEVNQQRREMCHHLQKVNSQLQCQNSALRHQLAGSSYGRRKTEMSQQPSSVYINLQEEQLNVRPTKLVQITQPTDRRNGQCQNRSCIREQKDIMACGSNKASPLRLLKAHQSIRTTSSPSQSLHRQDSVTRNVNKPPTTFNKRQPNKTIDVYSQNYRHHKGKENIDKAYC